MRHVRKLIAAIGSQTGFFDAYAFLKSKTIDSHLAILMYHRVATANDDWSLGPMSPDVFESQIEYFTQNYEILSLHQVAGYLADKRLPHRKSVVITMDDGYKDNYAYAYPILARHNVPATIFLIAGSIGTDELFWWDKVAYVIQHTNMREIELDELGTYSLVHNRHRVISMLKQALGNLTSRRRNQFIAKLANVCGVTVPRDVGRKMILSWDEVSEMSRNGIDFGAHTLTHPILTNVSTDEARREVNLSKLEIESRLGKTVDFFCYPNGAYSVDVSRIVRESGFIGAVTTDPNWIRARTDPYLLGRVPASDDFNTLKAVLSGFYGDLPSVLRRH